MVSIWFKLFQWYLSYKLNLLSIWVYDKIKLNKHFKLFSCSILDNAWVPVLQKDREFLESLDAQEECTFRKFSMLFTLKSQTANPGRAAV